jgi:hypothetical protein
MLIATTAGLFQKESRMARSIEKQQKAAEGSQQQKCLVDVLLIILSRALSLQDQRRGSPLFWSRKLSSFSEMSH